MNSKLIAVGKKAGKHLGWQLRRVVTWVKLAIVFIVLLLVCLDVEFWCYYEAIDTGSYTSEGKSPSVAKDRPVDVEFTVHGYTVRRIRVPIAPNGDVAEAPLFVYSMIVVNYWAVGRSPKKR